MNDTSAPTLVTGATGLVGNNVVRLLLARGEPVRALVRSPADPSLAGLNVDVIPGDVRDADAVRVACTGARAVVHCAGYVRLGWSNLEMYRSINVGGTRNVVAACRQAKIRLINVSSTDVFGRCSKYQLTDEETPPGPGPAVPYVVTKREAEEVVAEGRTQGLDAVTVNPSFMLGPWDWKPSSGKLLLASIRRGTIAAPPGWLSLCDVRDVAQAILAARDLAAAKHRYILAGHTLSMFRAFRLIGRVCGTTRPWFMMPPLAARIGGWSGDGLCKLTGYEPDINSAAVRMVRLPKNYSSALAERELNYHTRPAVETVRDAWQWLHDHGYR